MERRQFLRLSGAALLTPAAAQLLAACGGDDTGAAAAAGSPTTSASGTTTAGAVTATSGASSKPVRKVKLGFIALTDCAPLILAKELGYFTDRHLDVEITKQASWPALRDNLLNGQIDAAHCLFSMPLSVATGVGGTGSTDLKIAMVLNNNGQAITLAKDFAEVGYGDTAKAGALLNSKNAPSLAMTFPGGTHDVWLRYWLKACKADASKLKISPVPPPQMVQNMSVGNVQGYCVGEPWNAVAVQKDIGFTALATQDLWEHHPEKALVANAKFANEQSDTLKDLMAAVLAACKWLDDPANRAKAADTLGVEQYVNAKPDDIRGRLTGTYDLGAGLGTKTFEGNQMRFFRDGATNLPRAGHAIWFLSQYQRFGLTKSAPDYQKLVDEMLLTSVYREVAKAEGITVPDDDMAPFELKLDGATFDPAHPEKEISRP
jgi:nitrate/nitrite transport system substrate-binding protein